MAKKWYIQKEIDKLIQLGLTEEQALESVTAIYRWGISDCNTYFCEGRNENIGIQTLKDTLVSEM